MEKQHKYTGTCHCKAIVFELLIPTPIEEYPLICCNCSICVRKGMFLVYVPPEAVTYLQGKETLKKYVWGDKDIAFMFCPDCGVDIGNEPVDFSSGVNHSRVGMNARTLQDVDFEIQLPKMNIDIVDGRAFPNPGEDAEWKFPKKKTAAPDSAAAAE